MPEANNSYSQRLANEPLQKLQSIRLTVSNFVLATMYQRQFDVVD